MSYRAKRIVWFVAEVSGRPFPRACAIAHRPIGRTSCGKPGRDRTIRRIGSIFRSQKAVKIIPSAGLLAVDKQRKKRVIFIKRDQARPDGLYVADGGLHLRVVDGIDGPPNG